jgi:hypothetical protein
MDMETQKSELIDWIVQLNDPEIISKILSLKKRVEEKESRVRTFGSGRHFISYVADDFNEPLDDFKEYIP